MIRYTRGDILKSKTKGLVNTVNCEGFMGKGIAYQFKLKYPENNKAYVRQCNQGKFNIGDIFTYEEEGKIILNFPTKDKWRKKSEYAFIDKGLKKLNQVLIENEIESVSIPPLGCGNGGLEWEKVKNLIEDNLNVLSRHIKIVVFEPIFKKSFKTKIKKPPKLSTSHILLMVLKMNLTRFNKIRLQKTAFLNNIISQTDYFKFEGQNFGPYAHSIEILSKEIKEFQNYYNVSTEDALELGLRVIMSKNSRAIFKRFDDSLDKTMYVVNSIDSDLELELLTTILYIIKKEGEINEDEIIQKVIQWNDHKRISFNKGMILNQVDNAMMLHLIKKTLYNTYEINKQISKVEKLF